QDAPTGPAAIAAAFGVFASQQSLVIGRSLVRVQPGPFLRSGVRRCPYPDSLSVWPCKSAGFGLNSRTLKAAALVPHRAFRPQPVSRSDGERLANRGSHGEHVAITDAGCVPAVSTDTDSRERTANSPRRRASWEKRSRRSANAEGRK